MPKPLQLDDEGRIMNDTQTQKNQKDYDAYEAELVKKQAERQAKDKSMAESLLDFGGKLLGRPVQKKAKGGVIKSSASKRADGCAIRGKTRA